MPPTTHLSSAWRHVVRKSSLSRPQARALSRSSYRKTLPPPPRSNPGPDLYKSTCIITPPHRLKIHPPPPSARNRCPEPLKTFTEQQIAILDPTGSRTRLFARLNPDAAHVGDILMVRFATGDPFAGVCMNIRRQGVDTAVLLRSQLTRVGTEMWVKVYSPTVAGIEVVQRAEKRARRARLYYLRKPKHDRGSVQSAVDLYIRKRTLLGNGYGGAAGGKGGGRQKMKR